MGLTKELTLQHPSLVGLPLLLGPQRGLVTGGGGALVKLIHIGDDDVAYFATDLINVVKEGHRYSPGLLRLLSRRGGAGCLPCRPVKVEGLSGGALLHRC